MHSQVANSTIQSKKIDYRTASDAWSTFFNISRSVDYHFSVEPIEAMGKIEAMGRKTAFAGLMMSGASIIGGLYGSAASFLVNSLSTAFNSGLQIGRVVGNKDAFNDVLYPMRPALNGVYHLRNEANLYFKGDAVKGKEVETRLDNVINGVEGIVRADKRIAILQPALTVAGAVVGGAVAGVIGVGVGMGAGSAANLLHHAWREAQLKKIGHDIRTLQSDFSGAAERIREEEFDAGKRGAGPSTVPTPS